jgi:ABC-type transport system substrate-binding protein
MAAPTLMRASEALAQGVQPRRGGTLQSILVPEPPVLQIGVNNQGPTLVVASKIFEGLLTFSSTLEPIPLLAKSWTVSPDNREFVISLQENVTFHDGQPMTADDVVFSIMKFHMEVSPRARGIFALIETCEARDPHTVRIVLKQPFQPFLLMFDTTGCAIVPKHLFDGQDYRTAPAVQRPTGTGPFKFAEWQRGNFVRLERNPNYWRPERPYLDSIIYRVVPDSQSRRLALETGQVQLTQGSDIEPFDVPALRSRSNLEVQLLDAAGQRPNAQGVRFTVKHLVLPYGEVWSRLGEYLRQAYRQVGIALELESTDAGGWARRIGAWEYETSVNFVYQFGDPTLGVERTYVSSNIQKVTFTNTGGYSNPQVDELFAKARAGATVPERQAAFTDVQKILVNDVPQIWLMEMAFPTIHDKKVNNVITNGLGVHDNFDDVFIAS